MIDLPHWLSQVGKRLCCMWLFLAVVRHLISGGILGSPFSRSPVATCDVLKPQQHLSQSAKLAGRPSALASGVGLRVVI